MKTLVVLILSLCCLTSCASSYTQGANSPCRDSTYLALKHKPIDSMSAREFSYFKEKEQACELATRIADSQSSLSSYFIWIGVITLAGIAAILLIHP